MVLTCSRVNMRSMTGPKRSYRGVAPDVRLAERRARLLEAGLDVIGEVGIPALTMSLVIQRADLTERYFYEHFADRHAFLVVLFEDRLAFLDRRFLEALADTPPDLERRSRAAAGALVDTLTGDRRLARLFAESAGNELLRSARSKALARYAAALAIQIRQLVGIDARRHRGRLRVSTRMIVGGLAEALVGWLDGTLDESKERIVDECTRLCVACAAGLD